MKRGLRVVKTVPVTSATLAGSSVPENEHPVWSAASTYTKGQRVILGHEVYEAVAETGNTNKDPKTEAAYWARVGYTNLWRAFDLSSTTRTQFDSDAWFELSPGQAISSVVLRGLAAVTKVRLTMTHPAYGVVHEHEAFIGSELTESSWYAWTFEPRVARATFEYHGLPSYPGATLRIELEGGADAGVGVVAIGKLREFGIGVSLGMRIGLMDFSRKQRDEYGDVFLKQGDYADTASFTVVVANDQLNNVRALVTSLRGTPCLWSPSDRWETTTVWGFFQNFVVTIQYATHSECAIDLEGLT
ncbi:hypothetical protein FVQ98_14505 [Ottowia sp. GY511]|uniref:Carbohydrate-binding protein n=1 Tax=Ottowia flava TaxID=2675430 RepID=A0ABW4KS21_9BURK|nr:hypothetical protein [Ottowia sp. GY511]TXK26366.1 hypothetical protein FVQ98_14505 [Ottowia sp. GY511]